MAHHAPTTPPDVSHMSDEMQGLVGILSRAADISQTGAVRQELSESNGPVTAAAGGGGEMSALMDRLTTAMEGPAASTKKDTVPMPQDVPLLPSQPAGTTQDEKKKALEDLKHLQDAASIADMFVAILNAAKREKRGHPDEYRISDPKEAAQAFADMADSCYAVMVGQPLAGIYSFSSGVTTTFSRSMSRSELHLGFIAELFKGFSLTDAAMGQLDGILKSFVASLDTVSVETESTKNTVDQTIRIHQTVSINITGSSTRPIWIYQPRTRIVYMHVDAGSWRWATNKANHQSSSFNMVYTIADCDLNVEKWLSVKPALEGIYKEITGVSIEQYRQKKVPSPIDPKA